MIRRSSLVASMHCDGIELGGPDAEVDVGQEAAQHQEAIGRFDELGDFRPAHASLVDAREERVGLGDDALAQDGGRDRHARSIQRA